MSLESFPESRCEIWQDFVETSPGFSLDNINMFDSIVIKTTDFDGQDTGQLQMQLIPWQVEGFDSTNKPKRVVVTDTNLVGFKVGAQYMVNGASVASYSEDRGIIRQGCGVKFTPIYFRDIYLTLYRNMSDHDIAYYYKKGHLEKDPVSGTYAEPRLSENSIVTCGVESLAKIDYESGELTGLPWHSSTLIDGDDYCE